MTQLGQAAPCPVGHAFPARLSMVRKGRARCGEVRIGRVHPMQRAALSASPHIFQPRPHRLPPTCHTFSSSRPTGDVLGARELGRPDWPPGSVIYPGPDEPNLRVVRILERDDERGEDPEWFTVLVVEEA